MTTTISIILLITLISIWAIHFLWTLSTGIYNAFHKDNQIKYPWPLEYKCIKNADQYPLLYAIALFDITWLSLIWFVIVPILIVLGITYGIIYIVHRKNKEEKNLI